MGSPFQRKRIGPLQLTAMACVTITRHPDCDDGEAVHRLKCELLAQGFTYPQPWSDIDGAVTQARDILQKHPAAIEARPQRPWTRAQLADLNLTYIDPTTLTAIRHAAGTPAASEALARAEERERQEHAPEEFPYWVRIRSVTGQ